jgi:hypothetical protein
VVADKTSAGVVLNDIFRTSGQGSLVIEDEDVFVNLISGGATVDFRDGPIVLSAGTYRILAGNPFPKACVADGKVAAKSATGTVGEAPNVIGYDEYEVTTAYTISYVINGESYTLTDADKAKGWGTYNNVNGLDGTKKDVGHEDEREIFYPDYGTDENLPEGKFTGWYTTATWDEDTQKFTGVTAGSKNPDNITLYGQLTPYVAKVYSSEGLLKNSYTTFIEAAGKAGATDRVLIVSSPRAGDIFMLAHKYTEKDPITGEDVVLYPAKTEVNVGVKPALATELELDTTKKIQDFVAGHLDVDEGSYKW